LEARQEALEKGQKALESGQKELYALTKALEHRTEENTAQLISLNEKMNYFEGSVNSLKNSLSSLENRFDDFVKEQRAFNEHILSKLADMEDNVLYAVKMVDYHNKDIVLLKAKGR
ncbi:hypothetical protein SAMN02745133_00898, partial [Desulforamulus putei DSM 12395]